MKTQSKNRFVFKKKLFELCIPGKNENLLFTMKNNIQLYWSQYLSFIKDNIAEEPFKTWFAPIVPVSFQDKVLTIAVPSNFFYECHFKAETNC